MSHGLFLYLIIFSLASNESATAGLTRSRSVDLIVDHSEIYGIRDGRDRSIIVRKRHGGFLYVDLI